MLPPAAGFDIEGGGGGAPLTAEQLQQMQGLVASTSAALKRSRGQVR